MKIKYEYMNVKTKLRYTISKDTCKINILYVLYIGVSDKLNESANINGSADLNNIHKRCVQHTRTYIRI
jgi:hypothetical protein